MQQSTINSIIVIVLEKIKHIHYMLLYIIFNFTFR